MAKRGWHKRMWMDSTYQLSFLIPTSEVPLINFVEGKLCNQLVSVMKIKRGIRPLFRSQMTDLFELHRLMR
jgi:seryl-tRNA synthetase